DAAEAKVHRVRWKRLVTFHTAPASGISRQRTHPALVALDLDFRYAIDVYLDGAFAVIAAAPDLGPKGGHLLRKRRPGQHEPAGQTNPQCIDFECHPILRSTLPNYIDLSHRLLS